MAIEKLYDETPEASRPGWSPRISALSVVTWERDNGEREVTVGHSTYTPSQALALAATIIAAAAATSRDSGWALHLADTASEVKALSEDERS